MNKSQLIEALADKTGRPRITDRVVNLFFDSVKSALAEDDKVEIRGFGSFFLKEYEGYIGRNPKTGEQVKVPGKKLPVFRTGKDMKERVKSSTSELKNKK
ncbi:MAG: integration host factor subunit beta [SAR324 cluster bacterium]|nr:integration host factor subunit beta [SAR324 cluster bacterium]